MADGQKFTAADLIALQKKMEAGYPVPDSIEAKVAAAMIWAKLNLPAPKQNTIFGFPIVEQASVADRLDAEFGEHPPKIFMDGP